jgi:hypothetical protein
LLSGILRLSKEMFVAGDVDGCCKFCVKTGKLSVYGKLNDVEIKVLGSS